MLTKVCKTLFVFSLLWGYCCHTHASEVPLAYAMDSPALQWGPCPAFFPAGCQIAVLHGDPAKPNVDIFFKVPGNYDFPAHWHSSAERMTLLAGAMDVTYQGQATTRLKTGMYAYGPAKAVHWGRCVSATPCVLFIAFEAPLDAVEHKPAAQSPD